MDKLNAVFCDSPLYYGVEIELRCQDLSAFREKIWIREFF